MMRKKKLYTNKSYDEPKQVFFTDGSAIICGQGGIIIIESKTPYGMNNLFFKFEDFIIALN
jgi:hypothetical protein